MEWFDSHSELENSDVSGYYSGLAADEVRGTVGCGPGQRRFDLD